MKRYIYFGCATVLAVASAFLVLRSQHTVAAVFATHDIRAGSQITADDVEVRHVHDDGAPAGVAVDTSEVVGRFAALPLTAGEPVLARAVSATRSGSGLAAQYDIPDGDVAVAVPVEPAGAVGGMLHSGDHVDVYGTPLSVVHGAGSGAVTPMSVDGVSPGPTTALIGQDVLVLELRTDQGQPLDATGSGGGNNVHGLNFGSGKLGSVVLAVPAQDVERYAAAVSTESIYLALSLR